MTLMKPFLIGLTVVLLLLGIAFLVNYLLRNKKIDKTNPKAVRNQKLNLYLSIYLFIGTIIVGCFIFLIY